MFEAYLKTAFLSWGCKVDWDDGGGSGGGGGGGVEMVAVVVVACPAWVVGDRALAMGV